MNPTAKDYLTTLEKWTTFSISIFIIMVRIGCQIWRVGFKGVYMDDILMVLVIPCDILATIAARPINMSELSETLSTEELGRIRRHKMLLTFGMLAYLNIEWLLKACMLCFFGRILQMQDQYKYIKYAWILTISTWVAVILTPFIICRPTPKLWQVVPDAGAGCKMSPPSGFYLEAVVLNLVTDLFIVLIPLPMLFRSPMGLLKKIRVIFIFSLGIFVIITLIAKIAFVMTSSTSDLMSAHGIMWGTRQNLIAVVLGNIPMIHPVMCAIWRNIRNRFCTSSPKGVSLGLQPTYSLSRRFYQRSTGMTISDLGDSLRAYSTEDVVTTNEVESEKKEILETIGGKEWSATVTPGELESGLWGGMTANHISTVEPEGSIVIR